MEHQDAPPGKSTKYARRERERRFVLKRSPAGPCIRRAEISDLYITGSRLRLRQTQETMSGGRAVIYKLTQKLDHPDGRPGLMTTLYLNKAEHDLLRALPGIELKKSRYSVPPLGVDVFTGELSGLMMAEIEFDTAEDEARFQEPSEAAAEVTQDRRFTGGQLANMKRSELLDLLQELGLGPVDSSDLTNRSITSASA